ncbi:glycosyltransferase family 4 protein [candidate division KSB1 bacterium]
MKILFLTPYFYPEKGAPQTRLLDYSLKLTSLGHKVAVLTTMPNYPKGRVFDQYRGKFLLREDYKGIQIIRIRSYTSQKKGFLSRILNHLSFALLSIIPGVFIKDLDLIFVESPPLFDGITGIILSFLKRIPFVFNVADIWPQAAIELNMLNNRLLIKLSEKLEKYIYKRAEKVLIVTRGWYEFLKKRGVKEEKLVFIPNGADTSIFKPSGNRTELRKQYHFNDNFVIFFGGNHGLAQGLDNLIKAASYLKDYPDIVFVLMGDGPLKNDLINLKNDLSLNNVHFFDPVPLEEIPAYLEAADIVAVTLKNIPLMSGWVPVKLYEAMAMEKPVITNITGDTENIINESGAGFSVKPDSPESIAEAVKNFYRNKNSLTGIGKKGREYIIDNYNRDKIVVRLLDLFNSLAGKKELL